MSNKFKLKYKDSEGKKQTVEYQFGMGVIRELNRTVLKDYGVELNGLIESNHMFTFLFTCLEVLHLNATGDELTDDILNAIGAEDGQDFENLSKKIINALEASGLYSNQDEVESENKGEVQEGK